MSWKPEYAILLLISTVIDYAAGIQITKSTTQIRKKIFLWISIISNFGMLFAFKYFTFFNESLREVLKLISIDFSPLTLKVLLPVGISFYTFQTLSYTIEVYRGKINAERHFGIYAVYVTFFPQLVAGPIERAANLLPQFFKENKFEYQRAVDGLKLMLWGFFKKIVIADRLAIFVNMVYNQPFEYTGVQLILATVFFGFQIYCDFSGYSDIAIGSAQVMGYSLMDNFKRPYFSKSIAEFWRRWHISLSTWFKDYLYIPLGGNKLSVKRTYINTFVVFLISGLWHGANWTFVIWGALHGFYMVFAMWTKKIRKKFVEIIGLIKFPKFYKLVQVAITFFLVTFAWIFFRANKMSDAIYVITHAFINLKTSFIELFLTSSKLSRINVIICILMILFMECVHLMQRHTEMRKFLSSKATYLRWTIYILLIIAILIFGMFNKTEFIYFQF